MFNSVSYIRGLCQQRDIPISQLEKTCGFSNGYLNPKKLKKIPYDKAVSISKYLSIPVEEIFNGPPKDEVPTPESELKTEKLKDLRTARGISQQIVADYLEITRQTYNNYENGNQAPDKKTLLKLAAYFDVPVDYFLRGKEKAPALTDKDKRDVARDVDRIMGDLSASGDLMFDGVPMSDEARAAMAAAMRIGLEEARRRNKETYTPKKHQKE